jgi:tetratricopeptide (TPR) repeat protein
MLELQAGGTRLAVTSPWKAGLFPKNRGKVQSMSLKNILFAIIVVTVFYAGCELILAIAGVQPVLSTEDPFVGFAENIPLFVAEQTPDGASVLKTARNRLQLFNDQEFPAEKADNTYRIFCVGGSTTFGRPYDDKVSFCGWLRAYLQAADPARNWEIINAGGVSYASYRVARVMNELAQYQPDLFIVYTGQNEFLEQRSYGTLAEMPDWLLNLGAALSGTRVYTAMSRAISSLTVNPPDESTQQHRLGGEVDTILDHTIGPQSYHRDEALKQHIMTHYRLNLERMVRIARQADADIIFVKPAVDIRDMSPFKSEHAEGLDGKALAAWQDLYDRAAAQEAAGNHMEALELYRRALAIDDRYAELHYRIGAILFGMKKYDEAERSFRRAVQEDIAPLRILAPMQRDVVEVAETAGVPLVDYQSILRTAYRKQYGHTVFGSEYFVDHVHTNYEGYRLLGLALFDELARLGITRPDATWNAARREAVRRRVIASVNTNDEGNAFIKLGRIFVWAGKYAESYRLFQRALDILGPRPDLYDQLARTAYAGGDDANAIRNLHKLLEIFPFGRGVHARLAAIHANRGETDTAISHCRMELFMHPDEASTLALLGELLERQGKYEEAGQQYEEALRQKPALENTRIRLVYLLLKQDRYDEAQSQAEEVLRQNPHQYLAHNALGRIYMHRSDRQQAAQHFSEALRLRPETSESTAAPRRLLFDTRATEITVSLPREICPLLPRYGEQCPAEAL